MHINIRKLALFLNLFCLCPGLVATMAPQAYAQDAHPKKDHKKADSPKKGQKGKAKKSNEPAKSMDVMRDNVSRMVMHYYRKQYGAALVYCEKAQESMPDDVDFPSRFSIGMMCIELYTHNGRYEDALALASNLKKYPLRPDMLENICFSEATTLTRLHRWDDAQKKYEECPGKSKEGVSTVMSNVAELSMIKGDPEDAVRKYKDSLSKYPHNPHALYGIAVALSRTGKMEEAEKYFNLGVKEDPAFGYLENAFFEPVYDEDYESAMRFYLMHREKEALFYLDRYLNNETRMNYRAVAQKLAEEIRGKIKNNDLPIIADYPVLLDNVHSMAIDNSGKLLAFVTLEKIGEKIFTTVWTANLETGETFRRIQLKDFIRRPAMAFLENSSKLRILGIKQRYELDVAEPKSGYWCFDNPQDGRIKFGLTTSGEEILSAKNDKLMLSPWKDPWTTRKIAEIPSEETIRACLSHDQDKVFLNTAMLSAIVDVENGVMNEDDVNMYGMEFEVSSVAAHPSRDVFAIGVQSGTLIGNESGDFKLLGAPEGGPVSSVAFSPNGRYLAVLTGLNVEIWDMNKLNF